MLLDQTARNNCELERKALEERIVKEGLELWKRQKEQARLKKLKEQKEIRELFEKYWPFQHYNEIKPRGLRNLRLDGLFPYKDFQDAKRAVGSLDLGRPGGGAPLVTKTGQKLTRTREDPLLRFQFGSHDLRKCVDNTLRYKTDKETQDEYRKELDKLVEEKKQLQTQQKIDEQNVEIKQDWKKQNEDKLKNLKRFQRKPRKLDPIFYPCKNVNTHRKQHKLIPLLDRNNNSKEDGIELVTIMTQQKEKYPAIKVHLETTDITNIKKICNIPNRRGSAYLKELTQQVVNKQRKLKEMKAEEDEISHRHFDTWNSFWGRPGHGAPRSAVRKHCLNRLLYPQIVPITVS